MPIGTKIINDTMYPMASQVCSPKGVMLRSVVLMIFFPWRVEVRSRYCVYSFPFFLVTVVLSTCIFLFKKYRAQCIGYIVSFIIFVSRGHTYLSQWVHFAAFSASFSPQYAVIKELTRIFCE